MYRATTAVASVDTVVRLVAESAAHATEAFRDMGTSEWIAFGSMLAAWIATWQAIRSTRLSGRMYSLSVAEQRRTEPAVDVYLADSQIQHHPSEQRRIYVFHLLITNSSLSANSIKQISLSVEFRAQDRPPSNVSVPHDTAAADAAGVSLDEILRVPSPIAAGDSISGAAVFPFANALLGSSSVESYTVTVSDAHDREVHCQAILLEETDS